MLDITNHEIEAVAQRPSESLSASNYVETGESFFAVPENAFINGVLNYGDEAAHAHWVEAVAGETKA